MEWKKAIFIKFYMDFVVMLSVQPIYGVCSMCVWVECVCVLCKLGGHVV